MNTLDIIILIIGLVGLVRGLMRGLVKQVAKLAGIVIGLLAAFQLYPSFGNKLSSIVNAPPMVVSILSFIIVFIIVILLFTILAFAITKILEAICLGWLNRCLGAVVGVILYLGVTSLIIRGIEYFDTSNMVITNNTKNTSYTYNYIKDLSYHLLPKQ